MFIKSLRDYGSIGIIFLMYAIFASTLTIGKKALVYGPVVTYIGLRMFITGILFLGYYAYSTRYTRSAWAIKKQDLGEFALVACIGIGVSYLCAFWSLQYLTVAKTAFLFVLTPFFTAVIGWVYGVERISKKKCIGLIVGAFGMLPMLLSCQSWDELMYKELFCWDVPLVLAFISVFCYAYSWVIFKKLLVKNYNENYINGLSMFVGGLSILGAAFFLDGWFSYFSKKFTKSVVSCELSILNSPLNSPVTDWCSYLQYLVLIIVIGSFCFWIYARVLKKYSATLIAFFGFTEPFFAAIFAKIFLQESLSLMFFVSLFLVSIGLYIFYQDELIIT